MNSMNNRRNLCYLHNHIHQHWKFAWLAVMFDLPGQSSKHSCSSLWSGCWFILAWSSRKEQFFPPNFSGIHVLDLNFFGTASPLVLQLPLHELQFDQLLQLASLGPGINKKYGVLLSCQNILILVTFLATPLFWLVLGKWRRKTYILRSDCQYDCKDSANPPNK